MRGKKSGRGALAYKSGVRKPSTPQRNLFARRCRCSGHDQERATLLPHGRPHRSTGPILSARDYQVCF
eukprot:scaffold706_cov418-Prasinococcus_capsulatus_cf.AAC.52